MALARRAARVSKDVAMSVAGSGTRSGIVTRARAQGKVSAKTVGVAKVTARMDTQARSTAKEREAMARAACGRLALGVGLRSISSKDCPKSTNVQRVEEDIPEILFIGNVQDKGALEGRR